MVSRWQATGLRPGQGTTPRQPRRDGRPQSRCRCGPTLFPSMVARWPQDPLFCWGWRRKPQRIWEVRTDGSGLHRLLPGWNPSWQMCCGNWTPNGEYFVFEANHALWALRVECGPFRASQPRAGPIEHRPADGCISASQRRWQARVFRGREDRNEFLRLDLRSGQFALELAGVSGTELEFSKDEKWVSYASVPGGRFSEARLTGASGSNSPRPLSSGMPHWSPDGRQIAFLGSPDGKPARIYLVPFEGGAPRQVSNGESGKDGDCDPSWSPDGASLAFGTYNLLSVMAIKPPKHPSMS